MVFRRRTSPSIRTSAFTLVELVVVVLILGVLASIALPRFINHADQAKENSAAVLVDNIRRAIDMYKAETGNFPPTVDSRLFRGALSNPYDPNHPTPVYVANDPNWIYPVHLDLRPSSTFWYNRGNGSFTVRVPKQSTNAKTIALFNRVNDTNVKVIGDRN